MTPTTAPRRLIAGAAVLAAGTLLVSGCSMPQVANMSKDLSKTTTKAAAHTAPKPTATPTATATAAATATPTAAPSTVAPAAAASPVDLGDLAFGTLTRKLNAGNRNLVVTYWTKQNPNAVSATSPMILQLSAHMEGGDPRDAVKVSRFSAVFTDGSRIDTVADDRGEFIITPPFSYGSALTLRPSVDAPSMATLTVEFDLLVETAPGTGTYFRQTVLDNVRIAFRGAGSTS